MYQKTLKKGSIGAQNSPTWAEKAEFEPKSPTWAEKAEFEPKSPNLAKKAQL
jgi:hypothetical protein